MAQAPGFGLDSTSKTSLSLSAGTAYCVRFTNTRLFCLNDRRGESPVGSDYGYADILSGYEACRPAHRLKIGSRNARASRWASIGSSAFTPITPSFDIDTGTRKWGVHSQPDRKSSRFISVTDLQKSEYKSAVLPEPQRLHNLDIGSAMETASPSRSDAITRSPCRSARRS